MITFPSPLSSFVRFRKIIRYPGFVNEFMMKITFYLVSQDSLLLWISTGSQILMLLIYVVQNSAILQGSLFDKSLFYGCFHTVDFWQPASSPLQRDVHASLALSCSNVLEDLILRP